MQPGSRQKKAKSKKDQLRELNVLAQNLQMGQRFLQMALTKMGTSLQRLDGDMGSSMGILNDLQYRTLAMLEVGKFDKDELNDIAEKLKLKDYNKASDKEDAVKGYTVADVVAADSVVTLTSKCESDEDKAIFRTKFKLDESGNPEAQEKLLGKKAGDKVELKIAALDHVVEILAVKTAPAVVEVVDDNVNIDVGVKTNDAKATAE